MIRARFHIRKDDCDNDYRPVKWPIKYPYCEASCQDTSFSSNDRCCICMKSFLTTFMIQI